MVFITFACYLIIRLWIEYIIWSLRFWAILGAESPFGLVGDLFYCGVAIDLCLWGFVSGRIWSDAVIAEVRHS